MTSDRPESQSEYEDSEPEQEQLDQVVGSEQLTTVQGQIIPDDNVQEIEADDQLTSEYPIDTEYIELVHLKIRSLRDLQLEKFTKLKVLTLRQNLLESIGDLKHVSDELEDFDVYDNRIKHISSHLNDKVKLQNLDLSFNKIKTIKNIENLTNLTNLYFVQNKISKIANLDNFTKLTNLELGGNRIEKIEGLDKLENLQQLWLGKNKISKLEGLEKLTNLKILSIQSNRIVKVEGLENLVNLEELYISHNGINKLEGLEKNIKLTTLDVTSNRLQKLENLSHLSKLTDIWASYNKFDDFSDVETQFKDLKELDTVYFEGNPLQLSNPTSYRRKLILLLPQVNKIDATYVR